MCKMDGRGNLLYNVGNPNLVFCENLDRWDGEGDGREVKEGGNMYTYGQFMLMYGRNYHNIVN